MTVEVDGSSGLVKGWRVKEHNFLLQSLLSFCWVSLSQSRASAETPSHLFPTRGAHRKTGQDPEALGQQHGSRSILLLLGDVLPAFSASCRLNSTNRLLCTLRGGGGHDTNVRVGVTRPTSPDGFARLNCRVVLTGKKTSPPQMSRSFF